VTIIKIDETEKNLLNAAMSALERAYKIWGVKVGAAVLAEDGKIYEGCNVESCISGLGTCAERCAIDHAVLHGNRRIKMVAVVFHKESSGDPVPCGACLQYIHEFSENPNLRILMAKATGGKISAESIRVKKLRELLPFPYEK
jgi:cytidine deaminase